MTGNNLGAIETIHEWYDDPRLVVSRLSDGSIILRISADENTKRHLWICVLLSEERLESLEEGRIDLRTAITEPEDGTVEELVISGKRSTMRSRKPGKIPSKYLPEAGVLLYSR